jgi:drug/metabolite transporter superfamily protein YnfA
MSQARDIRARVGQRRKQLVVAAIAIISGAELIYVANNMLSAASLGQAFAAYVGVFAVAAGILYGASALLVSE